MTKSGTVRKPAPKRGVHVNTWATADDLIGRIDAALERNAARMDDILNLRLDRERHRGLFRDCGTVDA